MKELSIKDNTGISFWIISIAMIANTIFLLIERNNVKEKWQLPMTISILVTSIASMHYLYMRDVWVQKKINPVVYRYIDWFLTVPLQIMEFYLILSIDQNVPPYFLSNLVSASIIMIIFGFLGETGKIPKKIGFTIGMIAWFYILYEIFFGTGAKFETKSKDFRKKTVGHEGTLKRAARTSLRGMTVIQALHMGGARRV